MDTSDLDVVALRGGEAFEQRRSELRALVAEAAELQALKAEALTARNEALALLGHAERQLQKNRRAAEELAKAQAAAAREKTKFQKRYGGMLKAAR